MANYYFLMTAFPDLAIGKSPEMSFKELQELLVLNLSKDDLDLVDELLRPIDLYNMRAFWLGMPLDDRGRIKARELEEELLVHQGLQPYIIEYLQRYETVEERLHYFSSLYASMYRDAMERLKGFLLKYFQFEWEMRLVLTGLRAKQFEKNLVRELQFEDPADPFVAEILAQKDATDFHPPKEYEELKFLFLQNDLEPKALNRALLEYQFKKMEEMEEPQDFGIDRVLAYIAKFYFIDSISSLNQEKGMQQMSSYE